MNQAEFTQLIDDVSSAYQIPNDVLQDNRLTHAQKVIVLKQWIYDAHELEVAESENMRGDSKPSMMHQALIALEKLESKS